MIRNFYNRIKYVELESTCVGIGLTKWEQNMEGAKRANKKEINRIVKRLLPDLYDQLALDFYNPNQYFKTERHLILVHSMIEYFIRYKI